MHGQNPEKEKKKKHTTQNIEVKADHTKIPGSLQQKKADSKSKL